MEVTYNMTRADLWRCNLYLLHQNTGLLVILTVFSLVLPAGIAIHYYAANYPHPIPIKICVLLTYLAVTSLFMNFSTPLLCLQAAIQSRLPKPDSQRICTTIISREGVRDIAPERNRVLAWADVTGISMHQGDLYIRKKADGVIVPRSAFMSSEDVEEYYQTALEFWRHRAPDQTVSISLSTVLRDRLGAGETVLWQGRPSPTAYAKQKTVTALVITFGLFVPFGIYVFVESGVQLLGFILLIWAIVPVCLSHSLLKERTDALTTEYAVTDKSVLYNAQPPLRPPRSGTVALAQVEKMKYWKRRDGLGSLEFWTATDSVTFDVIPDVASIYTLVASARGQQPDGVNALFTNPLSSDPFADVLRPNEQMVWQGQPDHAVYLKDFWGAKGGIVAYPVFALLVVLAQWIFALPYILPDRIGVFIPCVFLGCWLIRLRYDACARDARRSWYAVTTERLLMLKKSEPGFFAEADLAPIKTMLKKNRLALYPMTNTLRFGDLNERDFAFGYLANPDEVRRIILAA